MIKKFFKENRAVLVKRIQARRMQLPDAEDVVQEAFVRALKYQDSFNEDRQELGAWFNTIMNNAFKDYRHANYTGDYSFCEELKEDDHALDDAEKRFVDENILIKVKEEIDKLSPVHADIATLILLKGYKHKEVAQVLDMKVDTVAKTIHRIRAELRRKYG